MLSFVRAYGIQTYGDRLAAFDIDEPRLGDHDVLVEVAGASVNQLDEKVRRCEFRQILPYRLPLVLGCDLSGVVVDVGAQVRSFARGDEVYASPSRIGAFTERVAIAEADLALKPASATMTQAAALPLVALTAWQALVERGEVRPGQKVLIHAGAGGVGSIAIQLARHLGATVATTASAANADFVRELGADTVIDYRTEDFGQVLDGYDLVLDSLGGENLEKSLKVLRPGGRVIGIAGPPDPGFAARMSLNPALRLAIAALSRRVRRQARRLGVTYEFLFVRASGDQLAKIAALVDSGTLRPIVARTYPFDQTGQALTDLAAGGHRGKLVVTRP